jgi:uncharacterized protein DUF551
MSKWIDSNERLPDVSPVLVLCADGSMHVAYKDNYMGCGEFVWITGGWETCCMCGGESRIVFLNPRTNEKLATHWMLLPEILHE